MAKLNAVGKRLFTDIVSIINNGRANDSNAKDIASVISKATKTKKSMVPEVISRLLIGYSMANDEDSDRIEETVKKAMDEDTDCKAKDSDDPVDTLEAEDEDTDEEDEKDSEQLERNVQRLEKENRDDKDKSPRQKELDKEDKKIEAGAKEAAEGIKSEAEKVKRDEDRANDAAAKAIDRYKQDVKQAREAEKIIRPLVGELSIVSDSAAEYYETAIKMVTGTNPPKGTPVASLKFMVENLTAQKQQQSRASDSVSVRATNNDWERIGATHLGNVEGI